MMTMHWRYADQETRNHRGQRGLRAGAPIRAKWPIRSSVLIPEKVGKSCVGLLMSTPASSHAPADFFAPEHLAQRLDPVLERSVAQKRIVGSVVLATRHGKVVYERAIGYADRESKRSLSSDALFRLASLTKPIVSVATLALVEKGVLALADPVARWLPDFRPALADGRVPTLTVWHLLTHTAGLGYGFFDEELDLYRRAGISTASISPGSRSPKMRRA